MDSTNGYNALLDRQQQQQQGLFDQYSQAVNSQPKMTGLFTQMQDQYGIPDAQKQLQGYKDQTYRVQGMLNDLVPNIAQRTQGTLTSQAMRDRMAAIEGQGLNSQLTSIGTAMQPLTDLITSGNQTIDRLLPLYEQDNANALKPLEMQMGMLDSTFNRQLTAYNEEQQRRAAAAQSAALSSYLTHGSTAGAPSANAYPSIMPLPSLPQSTAPAKAAEPVSNNFLSNLINNQSAAHTQATNFFGSLGNDAKNIGNSLLNRLKTNFAIF